MAGSWEDGQYKRGQLDGEWSNAIGLRYAFTADAADASIPDKATDDVAGALAGVQVVFDGTTPPNSLAVSIKDGDGVEIAGETVTASGYLFIDTLIWFTPGAVTISCSGNTTNSAEGAITLIFVGA